jgi:hypothetical protein
MYSSLTCVVDSDVDSEDYGDLFGVVCGLDGSPCAGIAHNATTGNYGAYGMCNATEQLGFALNQYAQSQSSGGCDFSGSAMTKASAAATGNCNALMSQAGTAGVGTVTSAPTGAAASSTSSPGAAAGLTVPSFQTGLLQLSLYVCGAALSGAAMILL